MTRPVTPTQISTINKLKANGHCRVTFFQHSRMVYHLSAKPLYEALGEKALSR